MILDIITETKELQHEREKIQQERQKLIDSFMAQNKLELPAPVPLRAQPTEAAKPETAKPVKKIDRKEISMKLKGPDTKMIDGGQWKVESSEDEEEEQINAAMNSVRKAVDGGVDMVFTSFYVF